MKSDRKKSDNAVIDKPDKSSLCSSSLSQLYEEVRNKYSHKTILIMINNEKKQIKE